MQTAHYALIISLSVLLWTLFTAWVRWPRIGLVLRQSATVPVPSANSTVPPPPTRDTFHLVVVNNGAEAASIANVGIRSKDRGRFSFDIEDKRDKGEKVKGPKLPARVEAHGAIVWTLTSEQLEYFPKGEPIVGYAHRYKTVRAVPGWVKDVAGNFKTPGRVWKMIEYQERAYRIHESKLPITKVG